MVVTHLAAGSRFGTLNPMFCINISTLDGGILKPIGHSRCVPDHFYAFQACSGHILTTLGHVLDRVQVFGDSDFSSKS